MQIYFSATPRWAVNSLDQEVSVENYRSSDIHILKTGTLEQNVLVKAVILFVSIGDTFIWLVTYLNLLICLWELPALFKRVLQERNTSGYKNISDHGTFG